MRLAPGGAGIRRQAVGRMKVPVTFRQGPRPLFPNRKGHTTTRNLNPRVRSNENFFKKKPLCGNPQGKNSERKLQQTSAPASTLSRFVSLFYLLPVAAEGSLEDTSPIHP